MEQLIKALPSLLQAAGDSEELAEAAAIAVWKHVAGEGLRPHTMPLRLHNKTLVVAVADSIWQKQMESMAGHLIFRLNSVLGQAVVTFIDFRIDPEKLERGTEQPGDYELKAAKPMPFELVAAAASIHDQELRRAFLGAASSCIRRLEDPQ